MQVRYKTMGQRPFNIGVYIADYSTILPAILLTILPYYNIFSNISDYASILLKILLISTIAGNIAGNIVSNSADSAILLAILSATMQAILNQALQQHKVELLFSSVGPLTLIYGHRLHFSSNMHHISAQHMF